jgi:hypothetical protein
MLGSFEYVYFYGRVLILFFSFLRLNFPFVFSDMLCTGTFHAVAHTQLHFFHPLHCSSSTVHVFCSHFWRSMKMIWTREAGLASFSTKSYNVGAESYDPNIRPTLFFTTPVNICPPRPPIDQSEETTS